MPLKNDKTGAQLIGCFIFLAIIRICYWQKINSKKELV